MVSQLLKVSSVKPSFDYIKDVYKVCLEKYLNNPSITFDSIKRGRKILQSEEEVDAYIAFYGAHHYYKLIEAFDALDTSRFKNSQLEIFSYGSGAATAACSLISYCRSRQINLPFQEFALIEPSNVALTRGVKYINQALSHQESEAINVKEICKNIGELEEHDLHSTPGSFKLHIFSNILDIDTINLYYLVKLIRKTQLGNNYFICINPNNCTSIRRIDAFYQTLSSLFKLSDIDTSEQDITGKEIWRMNEKQYSDQYPIRRYHKIFQANSI